MPPDRHPLQNSLARNIIQSQWARHLLLPPARPASVLFLFFLWKSITFSALKLFRIPVETRALCLHFSASPTVGATCFFSTKMQSVPRIDVCSVALYSRLVNITTNAPSPSPARRSHLRLYQDLFLAYTPPARSTSLHKTIVQTFETRSSHYSRAYSREEPVVGVRHVIGVTSKLHFSAQTREFDSRT